MTGNSLFSSDIIYIPNVNVGARAAWRRSVTLGLQVRACYCNLCCFGWPSLFLGFTSAGLSPGTTKVCAGGFGWDTGGWKKIKRSDPNSCKKCPTAPQYKISTCHEMACLTPTPLRRCRSCAGEFPRLFFVAAFLGEALQ